MNVVRAFVRTGEARYATQRAQRVEFVGTARHQLVSIRLVADVENEAVLRRIDEGMHGQNDFNRAERRGHMSAGFGSSLNDLPPNLARKQSEFAIRERLQICRRMHAIEDAAHTLLLVGGMRIDLGLRPEGSGFFISRSFGIRP